MNDIVIAHLHKNYYSEIQKQKIKTIVSLETFSKKKHIIFYSYYIALHISVSKYRYRQLNMENNFQGNHAYQTNSDNKYF